MPTHTRRKRCARSVAVEALEDRFLLTTIQFASKPVTYVEPDGDRIRISIRGGGRGEVDTDAAIVSIYGGTNKSRVRIRGDASISTFELEGQLRSLTGPRATVAQLESSESIGRVRLENEKLRNSLRTPESSRRQSGAITFSIARLPRMAAGASAVTAIRDVMSDLQQLSGVSFREVSRGGEVQFSSRRLKSNFDALQTGKRIYFSSDRSERYTERKIRAFTYHEFGHWLGFDHSSNPTSIMNIGLPRADLSDRDKGFFINAIRAKA